MPRETARGRAGFLCTLPRFDEACGTFIVYVIVGDTFRTTSSRWVWEEESADMSSPFPAIDIESAQDIQVQVK